MQLPAPFWFPVWAVQASHELRSQNDRNVENLLICIILPSVILLSQAEWELQLKFMREALLLNHEGQEEPPGFLNFPERSPGASGSNLSPRLCR